ncbi:18886_t:CDS:1, partial [Dentiscutata erythropus]
CIVDNKHQLKYEYTIPDMKDNKCLKLYGNCQDPIRNFNKNFTISDNKLVSVPIFNNEKGAESKI